jgi:uncharacterized delta-60 repeat protein
MYHLERLEPRVVLAAGTLDPSFGSFGHTSHFLPTDIDDHADAVAVLPDGRMLIGGADVVDRHRPDATVQRLTVDGARDVTFGKGGSVVLGTGEVKGMAVQVDGKAVVVVAESWYGDTVVYRLNSDGSLDRSFGTRGRSVAFASPGGIDFGARAVVVLPGGRILVGGTRFEEDPDTGKRRPELALVRLSASGRVNRGYGEGGVKRFAVGEGVRFAAMTTSPDGGVLVAGGDEEYFLALKLRPGGNERDVSFGSTGGTGCRAWPS